MEWYSIESNGKGNSIFILTGEHYKKSSKELNIYEDFIS